MRFARPFVATLVLLAGASTAEAQNWNTKTLKFQTKPPTPAVTALGYYVGPFTGTVLSDPTRPTLNLFCVDVLNQITWGKTWVAKITNLASGDFGLTRHGIGAKENYEKAAFLASQFRAPGVATGQWGGIQSAMWNLLNPGNPNGGTNVTVGTTEAYWLNAANNWYRSSASQTFDFSKWSIVTDEGAAGYAQGGGTQEFLTDSAATPEPEALILLGTGLLALFGVAWSRGVLRV